MTTQDTPTYATPEQISAARELYALGSDDNIEIDDNALVSTADDGVWVQAWVWVPNPADDDDDDEGPEPPYAGYESQAAIDRKNEVRRLEALRREGLIP